MILTPDFAFIHCEKTGGMSMTRYLVNAIDAPVSVVASAKSRQKTQKLCTTPERAAKVTSIDGPRHGKPADALRLIEDHGLPRPDWAFVMIRHPVDLMLSYYKHIRKPHVWKRRGLDPDNLTGHVKMAVDSDFDTFVRKAKFYAHDDDRLMQFFEPAGFSRLDVVPLERVVEYIDLRFSGQTNAQDTELEHRNKSKDPRRANDIDPETRAFIRQTYPRTEATYEAALEARWD